MLSLCTEHVVLIESSGARWAARPRWQSSQVWRGEEKGEPLAACANVLDQVPRGRFRYLDQATILLGFPHVHYWMLPWQPGMFSHADWQGFAQAIFSQQTGLVPQAWQFQIAEASFGQSRLAVATSLELLEDLRTLFKLKGLPLTGCSPLLTYTLTHYWEQLSANCVLAVPEHNALSCLYMQQGAISQVCAIKTAEHATLSDSLLTAQLLVDQQPATTLVTTHEALLSSEQRLGPSHPWLLEPST